MSTLFWDLHHSQKLKKMVKNAFFSEIMGNKLMNKSKVVLFLRLWVIPRLLMLVSFANRSNPLNTKVSLFVIFSKPPKKTEWRRFSRNDNLDINKCNDSIKKNLFDFFENFWKLELYNNGIVTFTISTVRWI